MTYSILGIGLLISQSVIAFNILQYLGASYLICIGIANFLNKEEQTDLSVEKKPQENIRPIDAIKTGFFVNVLNPKATLAFVSIFSAFVTPQTPLSLQIGFAVFAVCTTFLWYFLLRPFSASIKCNWRFQKHEPKWIARWALFLSPLGCASLMCKCIRTNGGSGGIRTLGQCLKRALLYQLSYRPTDKRAAPTIEHHTKKRNSLFTDGVYVYYFCIWFIILVT